ncbi:unnamed protein product [Prunus armeniaca]
MSNQHLFDTDSDEESMEDMFIEWEISQKHNAEKATHGGLSSRMRYVPREREAGHMRLMKDYFCATPVYNADKFRRRFRMRPSLFNQILEQVMNYDTYFQQRRDACGNLGLSTHQKLTAALCMIAYGTPADQIDENLRMAETTSIETLKRFCLTIHAIYGREYLRSPTPVDLARLLRNGQKRGFPGMLGSLDCMHWEWKNCPTAHHGAYVGHHGRPTIILEAVASFDTWIWHSYFGMPGSHNDLNVLYSSPLFVQGRKKKLFSRKQEAYRRDVERAFGILQSRFAILRGPARFWHQEDLERIMNVCIILHNIIVEDERDEYASDDDDDDDATSMGPTPSYYDPADVLEIEVRRDAAPLGAYLSRRRIMRDEIRHHALRNDLINHLWDKE